MTPRQLLFRLLHPLWRTFDALAPKRPDYWAFTTHHLHSDRFIENQRAVFEHVKSDPTIRKLIFHRGIQHDFHIRDAANTEVIRHGTLRGLLLLAQCKVVFLTHSIAMDYSLRWRDGGFSVLKLALRPRTLVNLWHSISVKRLLYTANEDIFLHTDRVRYRRIERRHYAGLIASSDIDSYAMSAMFYPLNYRQVWTTGLPRNDFLALEEERLPCYVKESLSAIRRLSQGRRLVVYAPTYRQTSVAQGARYYQFSDDEISRLKALLRSHDAVLGYRPHYFRNSSEYFNLDDYFDGDLIHDLSQAQVPEFAAVARECDLLITDYSSVYIETLYVGKPLICFGYDIEHYRTQQDGLLYDMQLTFPGPIVESFDALLSAIDARLQMSSEQVRAEQAFARRLFFKYNDSMNSARVVQRVFGHAWPERAADHPVIREQRDAN